MADAPVVHIGENSAEGVAFKLLLLVRTHDKEHRDDRKSILDTYAECLLAVKNPGARL